MSPTSKKLHASWLYRVARVLVGVPLMGVLAMACSSASNDPPLPNGSGAGNATSGTTTSSSSGGSCTEGDQRDCSAQLPPQGSTKGCFHGVQTCTNGAWTACGPVEVPSPVPPAPGQPQQKWYRAMPITRDGAPPPQFPVQAQVVIDDDPENYIEELDDDVSFPDADDPGEDDVDQLTPAGSSYGPNGIPVSTGDGDGSQVVPYNLSGAVSCSSWNKCDPSCKYFNENPGGPIQAVGGGILTGLLVNVPAAYLTAGLPATCTTNTASDCQFDDKCAAGACTPFGAGEMNSCVGGDLTIRPTCNSQLAVCNHGSSTVKFKRGRVYAFAGPGVPGDFASCSPNLLNAYAFKSVKLNLKPGACRQVSSNFKLFFFGLPTTLSNGDAVVVNPTPGFPGTKASECNYCNNWSEYNTSGCSTAGNYTQFTYVQDYQAVCTTPGTHVQWGFLAYDTSTPSDSFVDFYGYTETNANVANLGAGTPFLLATAEAGPPDTQIVPLSAPVDLYAAIGAPDATYDWFELEANIVPSSDALQTPSLNKWQISYSCPYTE